MSKIIRIFLKKKFIEEYQFRGTFLATFVPKISEKFGFFWQLFLAIQQVWGKIKSIFAISAKGQLISKAHCQTVDSPKKWTNEFAFFDLKSCYVVKSNSNCSFFLENLWFGNLLSKLTDLYHTFNLKCFYQIPLTWWKT